MTERSALAGHADTGGDVTLAFDPFAAPTSLTLTVTALDRVTCVHTPPVFEGTAAPEDGTPALTALRAVRPNPTSGPSEIECLMSRDGQALLEVYNTVRQRVRTLVRRREP